MEEEKITFQNEGTIKVLKNIKIMAKTKTKKNIFSIIMIIFIIFLIIFSFLFLLYLFLKKGLWEKIKSNIKQKINFTNIYLNNITNNSNIIVFTNITDVNNINNRTNVSGLNNINVLTSSNNTSKETKVCVCTPAKKENRYIREFVQHYEKYGVDKMFLYDNNDIDGEKFDEILKDYISKGFVEVLNWRGKKNCMYEIMNDCYRNNKEKYDWLIFYEVDEFIHLTNYTNVKDFLNEKKFERCEIIHLNLVCHTDNNLLYYENKSLAERFSEITPKDKLGAKLLEVKAIIRGHLPRVRITNIHRGDQYLKKCNGFGRSHIINIIYATEIDDKYYYIDHYFSKSTEEFIEKLIKRDLVHLNDRYKIYWIRKYFAQSNITKEKIDFIENRTGLNLTQFRNITDIKEIPFDFFL